MSHILLLSLLLLLFFHMSKVKPTKTAQGEEFNFIDSSKL